MPYEIKNVKSILKYVHGDLLLSDCTVIMHQANCMSTMASGIAKSIVDKYPRVRDVDIEYDYLPEDRLGTFTVSKGDPSIVNLYGQYNFGPGLQTIYEELAKAIDSFLHAAKSGVSDIDLTKVGLPYKMGCDRAGGDWEIVSEILERLSLKHNIDIYVYKLGGKR